MINLRSVGHVRQSRCRIGGVTGAECDSGIIGWVLSLSAARAPRNTQGRGPFNSDATALLRHRNM